ncbi:CobW/P47K C-terminal domain protein [Streptomyces graminofaciens]|uniref:CobW/P47K C-terminal domain protein n=1 Tax=Streptomyces graminofaciens TaxID=68212 RepID=A0ABN5VQ05_9ACTN|nr:GTP-binding protein [Streptomyces graminofaciens]BBC35547.1 CobW/P47K C-terminal domain protein [Streptomyces graminofaciens]
MTQLSVAIVGGLHADARRAAVEALLAGVPGSVALHHDLSTATDGKVLRTVRDAAGLVSTGEAPLVNDCACCALREDLVPELERLADAGLTRLAVVELWDSVEPKAMAEVVAASGLRLTSVITAVDPALLLPYLGNGDDLAERGLAAAATDQRTVADTFARQLEYAPVLAVLDSEDADDEDRALLAQLHPTAHRVPIDSGDPTSPAGGGGLWADWFSARVPEEDAANAPERGAGVNQNAAPSRGATSRDAPAPEDARQPPRRSPALLAAALAGFDVEAAAAAQHPACALLPTDADECGVTTLVWHRRRPFHPERLYAALEDLCCAAARSRGRFWLAERPDTLLHWDAAGGALCVETVGPWLASLPDAAWDMVPPVRRAAAALDWHPEHGDRCQHLVFTSPGLDRDGLEQLLESCLLTDAEYAAGRDAWSRLPRPFDTFLEV